MDMSRGEQTVRRQSIRARGRASAVGEYQLDAGREERRVPVRIGSAGSAGVGSRERGLERERENHVAEPGSRAWEDLPAAGDVIDVKWRVTYRNDEDDRADAGCDAEQEHCGGDEEDEDFQPRSRRSLAKPRPAKRAKSTKVREQEKWWPAIVVHMDTRTTTEEAATVGGIIRYTKSEDEKVFAAAGEDKFQGNQCEVEFATRLTSGDVEPIVFHSSPKSKNHWRHYAGRTRGGATERLQPFQIDADPSSVARELSKVMEAVAELQAEGLRRRLTPDAPQEDSHPSLATESIYFALQQLRAYGTPKLLQALQGHRVGAHGYRPPPEVVTACSSEVGGQDGEGAAKGLRLEINDAFPLLQSEFNALAMWCSKTQTGRSRLGVTVPSFLNLNRPSCDEKFRIRFDSYGDFCDACDVPMRLRNIFLWDEWLGAPPSHNRSSHRPSAVCVVGSVKVLDSPIHSPLHAEAVMQRTSIRTRVVLLGRSWAAVLSPRHADGVAQYDRLEVPNLRQTNLKFVMGEPADSESPFICDRNATVHSLHEEVTFASDRGPETEATFDMIWTPRDYGEIGLSWAPARAPGSVSFRIPVVCIRSRTLVESTRRLIGGSRENYAAESCEERRKRLELGTKYRTMAAASPHADVGVEHQA